MGRASREDYSRVMVNLNAKLLERIQSRFHDPVTGKAKYGAVSNYLERLALQDMEAHDAVNDIVEGL